jgi:hypothetical protein
VRTFAATRPDELLLAGNHPFRLPVGHDSGGRYVSRLSRPRVLVCVCPRGSPVTDSCRGRGGFAVASSPGRITYSGEWFTFDDAEPLKTLGSGVESDRWLDSRVFDRTRDANGSPPLLEGLGRRLEDGYDSGSAITARAGALAILYAFHEMFRLFPQRLEVVYAGAMDIAVPVREVKIGVGVIVGRSVNPFVVDLDFFLTFDVVIDQHLLASYNGSLPDLLRIEPTGVDESDDPVAVIQSHGSDVFNALLVMALSLAVDALREVIQEIGNDRNVVRCKVPANVDVRLKETEVHPRATDVERVPYLAGLKDYLDLVHRGGVFEGVANHENALSFFRNPSESERCFHRIRHRLFDENVFTGEQRLLR